MEKLGKIAIVCLIIGIGLLLLDLLFCFMALANMEQIGSTPEWQSLVDYLIIAAGVFLSLSILLGIFYAIARSLE